MTRYRMTQSVSGDDRRGERYDLLEWLRSRSSRGGAKICMRSLSAGVPVAGKSSGAVHVGAAKCGSPWSCPQCAPTINEGRATEIDEGLSTYLAAGGRAWFVTVTVSHKLGDHLADVLKLVSSSWRALCTSRRWADFKSSGYVGQIKAVEITHGANGWHPYLHVLILTDGSESIEQDRQRLRALGTVFSQRVAARGGRSDVTSSASPGWNVRPVLDVAGIADYLTKVEGGWGAGLEVARGDVKLARGSSSTPFQLLADARSGDKAAWELFAIYERVTAGKRRLLWSRGLKSRLGVEDLSDEDLADVEVEPDEIVVLAVVPAAVWHRLQRRRQAHLLVGNVSAIATGTTTLWNWPDDWLLVRPAVPVRAAA